MSAVVAFAATDIDDLVILSVLFTRRGPRFRTWHIVAGQYLGIAALVAVGVAVSRGLAALPDTAIAALGLIPFALGVHGLARAWRGAGDADGAAPVALGVLGVAGITIANGGDNVAVYAPLFATFDGPDLAVTAAAFAVMVAVWCAAAALIGSHRRVIGAVDRAGAYLVPVVLIGLGLLIVARAV